jgi:uncharacterized 2Fe-2S/4Fe-4S cluster protein (DUF4445 family)
MPEERAEASVVFTPSGKRGRFPVGTPVLQAARSLGVDLDSVCGGRGICGRCKVVVVLGDFAKHGIQSRSDHLSPISASEKRYALRGALPAGTRLSCHSVLQGDVVIDVPPSSQVHRQVVRKDYQARDLAVDPVVHLYYVEVAESALEDPRGDAQRLLGALEEQWGLAGLRVPGHVLPGLQATLRAGGWKVTAAVRETQSVVSVAAGLQTRVLGVAVDVGSTTVAAHLCDLGTGEVLASAGIMNPQIRFGEDLMSRVSYAMLNEGGDLEMTRAVRGAIDNLVVQLADDAGIDTAEILELTFVCNPIMHHLLLGLSPIELGQAPFPLATDCAVTVSARELGLGLAEAARAYVLPCIAGHVGADAAGMLLAEAPWREDRATLLVDVGTNAEIVLGNRQRLLAASSPTGPAFEGAQISGGQRATAGAIERVRIDRTTLEPRFKVVGHDLWSDDPRFAEGAGELRVTGICGTGIIEAVAELFLAGVIDADGRIRAPNQARSPRVVEDGRTSSYVLTDGEPSIRITQNDVRAIQLAKAALYAGVRLLMDRLGIERVDRIRLAGAFGAQIDVKYAMVLGMIPDCELEDVSSAGNAAGTGAVMALLSQDARTEIETRARRVEKIELAVEPAFQEYFVAAMAFPHRSDPFPALARRVDLPERTEPISSAERAGRRRRGSSNRRG